MTPRLKLVAGVLVVWFSGLAAWGGHMAIVRYLYDSGAEAIAAKDFDTAKQRLTWAANFGDRFAMRILATHHLRGSFGRIDFNAGEKWLLQCSLTPDPDCQEVLGLLYWTGSPNRQPDFLAAENWLAKAAAAGRQDAQRWLPAVRNKQPVQSIFAGAPIY